MVKGLERFREYFAGQEANYALIGGAACDILFVEAGLPFRATRDFDIVLCVEAVSAQFGTVIAEFLAAGGYQARERSTGQREYYRFHRPSDQTFPAMIELFARRPNMPLLPDDAQLSPISVEEEVISLSAILLDDNYFKALRGALRVIDGISLVDERILIPFKARAYLDLSRRKAHGQHINAKNIRKHCGDVFRLVQLLPGEGNFKLAGPVFNDIREFLKQALIDRDFDYGALNLPILFDDATTILTRFYLLDNSE